MCTERGVSFQVYNKPFCHKSWPRRFWHCIAWPLAIFLVALLILGEKKIYVEKVNNPAVNGFSPTHAFILFP
jgi:hypothetical protein